MQVRRIDQSHHECLAFAAFVLVQQLIGKRLPTPAAVDQHVLQRLQPLHVLLHLEVGPAAPLPHVLAAEPDVGLRARLAGTGGADRLGDGVQQPGPWPITKVGV